ncbi:hypothetical protein D3C76_790960 [compost metagenome]
MHFGLLGIHRRLTQVHIKDTPGGRDGFAGNGLHNQGLTVHDGICRFIGEQVCAPYTHNRGHP